MNSHTRKGRRVMALAVWPGLLALALFASPAHAQRGGFAPGAGARAGGRPSHGDAGRGRGHRGHRGFYGSGFGNYYPFYDAQGDADDGSEPPPAPIIMQAAATPAKATEPLVMELRGDHWVRLTIYGPQELSGQPATLPSISQTAPGQPSSHDDSRSTRRTTRSGQAALEEAQPTAALPPAVLVFRDGHQEEAAKYTIVGSTIFIKADFWSSGSWTHEVPIAKLDIPATMQANRERGTKFSLPSRVGEVMMRP